MNYCNCMLPVVEAFLAKNKVYDMIAAAESDLLLQPHEWKYLLARLGYVNNDGHWIKSSELKISRT